MSDGCNYIQFLFPNKVLRNHPSRDAEMAHRIIGKFMTAHGFEENKYSDIKGVYYTYTSENEMTAEEAAVVVRPLFEENAWLHDCAGHVPMTEVGKTVSLLGLIKGG